MSIYTDQPTNLDDATNLIERLRHELRCSAARYERELKRRPECVVVDPDFSPNLTRRMDCTEFPRLAEFAGRKYDVVITAGDLRYTFTGLLLTGKPGIRCETVVAGDQLVPTAYHFDAEHLAMPIPVYRRDDGTLVTLDGTPIGRVEVTATRKSEVAVEPKQEWRDRPPLL